MTTKTSTLEVATGHRFENRELLSQALKHPSLDIGLEDNQRLEFLGDAVLGLIVTDALYQRYPDEPEGRLARMRASIVSGKSLAEKAARLDLASVLEVSEAQHKHRPEPSGGMLEDAFEALVGAIYLDGGLPAARAFVEKTFDDELSQAPETAAGHTPKNQLQEWSQQNRDGARPEYRLLDTEGPDHDRRYTVEVRIDGHAVARGSGSSKKHAEAEAAARALQSLEF